MSGNGSRTNRPGSPGGTSRWIRFGSFEADLATRELRENGLRVKLQDQPFRLLTMLLKRPGEVVARAELRDGIWSDGTFVEFEDSLNTSINKLRRALGESAEQPRYIETVPRRGYRFIGRVGDGAPAGSARRLLPAALAAAGAAVIVLLVWHLMYGVPASVLERFVSLTSDASLTWQPALSPDGNHVAYSSIGDGERNFDIWIRQIGGGPPVRLTTHRAQDYSPAFSPDGSQIAFLSTRDGGGIYTVSRAGGEPSLRHADPRLLFVLGESASRVGFSPDGQWLAYHIAAPQPAVCVIPLSGGKPREFHPDNLPEGGPVGVPVWLPDSRHILFTSP
ncbi:MAG: hypothetical protein GY953_04935, partial [bacterium]|nr:hypothetical protein [bacterium]